MKILFITINKVDNGNFGGAKATYRNYTVLQSFAEVEVYLIQKRSSMKSIISIVQGNFPPVLNEDKKAICAKFQNDEYDAVFIDSSVQGNLSEAIRKVSDIPQILFFHNCEHDYIDVRFAGHKGLKSKVYQKLVDKAERQAVEASDIRIVFTKRDKKRIEELYKAEVQFVIPIGMSDTYVDKTYESKEEPYCLLFGPKEAANEEAFRWFVDKVSPGLKCKTLVAGKGFDTVSDEWTTDKVMVRGFVEDLGQMYAEALCVAIPLISGGGMKIKTSEALMYGKYIFGTDEAFVGYDLDYDTIGGLCNTPEKFIDKINALIDRTDAGSTNDADNTSDADNTNNTDNKKQTYFNKTARQAYVDNYSLEAGKRNFEPVRKYIEDHK